MRSIDAIRERLDRVRDAWDDRARISEDVVKTTREVPSRWRGSDMAGKLTIATLAAISLIMIALTLL